MNDRLMEFVKATIREMPDSKLIQTIKSNEELLKVQQEEYEWRQKQKQQIA